MSTANDPQVHQDVVAALAPAGHAPAPARTFGAGLGSLGSALPSFAIGQAVKFLVHTLIQFRPYWEAAVPTVREVVAAEITDPADRQALREVADEIFA